MVEAATRPRSAATLRTRMGGGSRDEATGPAPAATSTNAPPRRCSAKARSTPGSCSSASSRATRRISPAGRSSARPGSCSTARSARPGSTAAPTYVTNAVKHFKFEPRGKRRIHQKPEAPRDRGLPLVDRAGAPADPPARHGRARRHRRPLPVRQGRDHLRHARPRRTAARRRRGLGDGPPELPAPRPGRQGSGICPLRRGSARDRRAGEGCSA